MVMKRLKLLMFLLVLAIVPALQSCDDDDDSYSLDNYLVELATVNINAGGSVYFVLDDGETLWPAASYVPYQGLEKGTRVIGSFTVLSNAQNGYDHFVRLNDYSKVLTKGVIDLTEANKDSIGDDPVRITDMWVSGEYLNVQFDMNVPRTEKHRVNLVRNTTLSYTEEAYAHLEFRYNDMNDVTDYVTRNIVSFRLGNYGPSGGLNGLKIRINSAVNGEKIIQIDYPTLLNKARVEMKGAFVPEKIK